MAKSPPPDPALPAVEVAATTMVVRLLFSFGGNHHANHDTLLQTPCFPAVG